LCACALPFFFFLFSLPWHFLHLGGMRYTKCNLDVASDISNGHAVQGIVEEDGKGDRLPNREIVACMVGRASCTTPE
jgi:hypothetical protein